MTFQGFGGISATKVSKLRKSLYFIDGFENVKKNICSYSKPLRDC